MVTSDGVVASAEASVLLKELRQELKEWETSFFTDYKRKAGREDIKQHHSIGRKYKLYNELRYPTVKTTATEAATPSKKRRRSAYAYPPPVTSTPNKRPKIARPLHPLAIDPYDALISTQQSPTTHWTSIGPTPQKNGMVLGLFDVLSPSSHSQTLPKHYTSLAVTGNVQDTPSKRPSPHTAGSKDVSAEQYHHRPPLSVSKQACLNAFLTPSTCRVKNSKSTPSSHNGVSNFRFDETPNFLRRDSQRAFTGKENKDIEDYISWSPMASRHPPKGYAGKGLSALVKGLREMEEERLDEELDMLKEIEDGDTPAGRLQEAKVLVIDSQRPDMPLGPDGSVDLGGNEDFADEGKGRDGKPLKVWKKKGQKRTTRKVVIKPTTGKWKPEPAWNLGNESEDDDEILVAEDSQVIVPWQRKEEQGVKDEEIHVGMETKELRNSNNRSRERGEGRKEGFATTVKKKISATAHANFRTLKIKNKQSKGKRFGSFRRKR